MYPQRILNCVHNIIINTNISFYCFDRQDSVTISFVHLLAPPNGILDVIFKRYNLVIVVNIAKS